MTFDPLNLAVGDSRCTVAPDAGGSLASWTIAGQQMLRTASAAAVKGRDPLGMASFPLVPYSNRIANGRFDWDGESIVLRPNFAPEPHSIHGVGWTTPWTVVKTDAPAVSLSLAHAGDENWPWAFEAEQRITLALDRLTLKLTATNRHETAVPLRAPSLF